MDWVDWSLKDNPFQTRMTYNIADYINQPFLVTRPQEILKFKLMDSLSNPYPRYELIIGERGIGKSSTLIWLTQLVKDKPILSRYIKQVGDGQMGDILAKATNQPSEVVLKQDGNYKRIIPMETELNIKTKKIKHYFFLDMPDIVRKSYLDRLADFMENCLRFNISVFIAMNQTHYDKMDKITEILGKYTQNTLMPFNFEESEEMIISRLLKYRINGGDGLMPFTKDAINLIHRYGSGIPRNVLSAAEEVCIQGLEEHNSVLDAKFTESILTKDNFAKKILKERIYDIATQKAMFDILITVKDEFGGKVKSQKDLVDKLNSKFGWSRTPTLKKIHKLQSIGLLSISTSPDDFWTKIITVKGVDDESEW